MRINFPEKSFGTVLFEQCLKFDRFDSSRLDELGAKMRDAFDKVLREHPSRNGLTHAQYEIIFYRGELVDWNVFGYPLSERFCLGSKGDKFFERLYGRFNTLLEEVKEDLMQRPGPLNLDIFIIGYKDYCYKGKRKTGE